MKVLSFYELLQATFESQKAFSSVDELIEYAGPIYRVVEYDTQAEDLYQDELDLGKQVGFIFESNLLLGDPIEEENCLKTTTDGITFRYFPIDLSTL